MIRNCRSTPAAISNGPRRFHDLREILLGKRQAHGKHDDGQQRLDITCHAGKKLRQKSRDYRKQYGPDRKQSIETGKNEHCIPLMLLLE
ncbi:MAG: hypothetical protein PF501_09050 [Salinisphaera sp.]|nr:hypothetical protein [Salinisphaera sp.]